MTGGQAEFSNPINIIHAHDNGNVQPNENSGSKHSYDSGFTEAKHYEERRTSGLNDMKTSSDTLADEVLAKNLTPQHSVKFTIPDDEDLEYPEDTLRQSMDNEIDCSEPPIVNRPPSLNRQSTNKTMISLAASHISLVSLVNSIKAFAKTSCVRFNEQITYYEHDEWEERLREFRERKEKNPGVFKKVVRVVSDIYSRYRRRKDANLVNRNPAAHATTLVHSVMHEDSNCLVCGNPAEFFCSGCGPSVPYCSDTCQRNNWSDHKNSCIGRTQAPRMAVPQAPQGPPPPPDPEAENLAEIRFYMHQVYLIIIPVYLCIFLSILWVKISKPSGKYFGSLSGSSTAGLFAPVSAGSVFAGDGQDSTESVRIALIILAQMIGATILMVILVRCGCMKVLYAFFGLVVTGLLGLFGYILGTTLLFAANLPLDWLTFMFFLWNLTLVGVTMIFYKGPTLLRQGYLVLMSSLMALSLTNLPDLTTWLLLGLLAVWDLVAVLCPFGPLRLLLEAAKNRGQELPSALLYSAAVWLMASPPEERSPTNTTGGKPRSPAILSTSAVASMDGEPLPVDRGGRRILPLELDREAQIRAEEEEDEASNLKLGLGDFVFYSVLVARAATYDWVTTVTCVIAVTTGLTMTIFLLAIYKHALPALPISIAFGILFYFVSSLTLTPFSNELVQGIPLSGDFGFGIGLSGGGFIHF